MYKNNLSDFTLIICNKENYSGAYDNVVPPLPIPNREVKCVYADGTANVGE